MTAILNWLWTRIQEPSTWAGLSAALLAAGTQWGDPTLMKAAASIAALVAIVKGETGGPSAPK